MKLKKYRVAIVMDVVSTDEAEVVADSLAIHLGDRLHGTNIQWDKFLQFEVEELDYKDVKVEELIG